MTDGPITNPRFLAYARAHGRTAEAQLVQDTRDWPGDRMAGFILWNNARIVEFSRERPEAFFRPLLTPWDRHGGRPQLIDQEAYDLWLRHKAEALNRDLSSAG